MADDNNPQIIKYTLAGAVFRLIFPILSTGIEIIEHNLFFTISSFISEQISNPLLWIIDSAVPVLAFLGYQVGAREKKLLNQAQHLEKMVAERSEEILR